MNDRDLCAMCLDLREIEIQHLNEEITRLRTRHAAHLALIDSIIREALFPDEIRDWQEQRVSMTTEIGTLRAQLDERDRQIDSLEQLLALCAEGAPNVHLSDDIL